MSCTRSVDKQLENGVALVICLFGFFVDFTLEINIVEISYCRNQCTAIGSAGIFFVCFCDDNLT